MKRRPSLFFTIAVLACAMMPRHRLTPTNKPGPPLIRRSLFPQSPSRTARPTNTSHQDGNWARRLYAWGLGRAGLVHAQMSGQGWIAFSSKGKGMDGANMVIGYIDSSGKVVARNDLCRGWSHPPAATQGVLEFAVLFSAGATTLEFSCPVKFAPGYGIEGFTKGKEYSIVIAGNDRGGAISSKHKWLAQENFVF